MNKIKQDSAPLISQLPPPPPGRSGWPWTVSPNAAQQVEADDFLWPRISIVTPSYNQDKFIEETIRSVLLQGYPNLEFIIMDGGSSDTSVDIIRKYDRWLTCWTSSKDDGQAAAINAGFRISSGAICNWLNSDDTLAPGALAVIGTLYSKFRDADIICGTRLVRPQHSSLLIVDPVWQNEWKTYPYGAGIFPQEAAFFSRNVLELAGPLDEKSHFKFDVLHYNRIMRKSRRLILTNAIFSIMNSHADQKTRQIERDDKLERIAIDLVDVQNSALNRLVLRTARTRLREIFLNSLLLLNLKRSPIIEVIDYDWTNGKMITRLLSGAK